MMSHLHHQVHSPRTDRNEKISYHRSLPPFDLNSRVKLPPIIKNELLGGRNTAKATLQPPTFQNLSTSVSSFSRVNRETQLPTKWTRTSETNVNHVEKSPIHFPNSYVVLPPIGQTTSWSYSGISTLQEVPRDVDQTRSNVSNRTARRRPSAQRKRTENEKADDKIERQSKQVKRLPDTTATAHANSSARREYTSQKDLFSLNHATYPYDDALRSLTEEQVQICEIEPVHVLERLELSKEALEFLESKNSQRRGGKCVAIDPSLKSAVDIIRDNLLRQTMEELCMIW